MFFRPPRDASASAFLLVLSTAPLHPLNVECVRFARPLSCSCFQPHLFSLWPIISEITGASAFLLVLSTAPSLHCVGKMLTRVGFPARAFNRTDRSIHSRLSGMERVGFPARAFNRTVCG